jgi:TetR/AcrR family tetracycline transcriptional repressor
VAFKGVDLRSVPRSYTGYSCGVTQTKKAVRAPLRRDTLIAGAVRLADREGLDAVTVRRLAQQHDVTPMALYWHFKDKEQILDGLAEHLLDGVALPAITRVSWHAQLRTVLDTVVARLRPHPALANLVLPRLLASPAGLRIADRVLALLRQGGFASDDAAEVGTLLMCSVVAMVTNESEPATAKGVPHRKAVREKAAALGGLDPDVYPNVVALAAELATCVDHDSYYRRGIDVLVRGVRDTAPDSGAASRTPAAPALFSEDPARATETR